MNYIDKCKFVNTQGNTGINNNLHHDADIDEHEKLVCEALAGLPEGSDILSIQHVQTPAAMTFNVSTNTNMHWAPRMTTMIVYREYD